MCAPCTRSLLTLRFQGSTCVHTWDPEPAESNFAASPLVGREAHFGAPAPAMAVPVFAVRRHHGPPHRAAAPPIPAEPRVHPQKRFLSHPGIGTWPISNARYTCQGAA